MTTISQLISRIQACIAIAIALGTPAISHSDNIDFNRDIRPILAAKCFACHGPDEEERQADLRLDQRDAAIEFGAITPGQPDDSELVRRVFSTDPDEQMPPPDSEAQLTDDQKERLRKWVSEGAEYAKHWAFVAPKRPAIPSVEETAWPRNGIDHFVLTRLEQQGLRPSPEADSFTLVRRLYLDLIGLPPAPDEADQWVSRLNSDPVAYDELVSHLLESEHYGERWARPWLDLARYADTNGYEKDRPRSVWPYRDWVIRALNADKPFDEFTVEQIAGDMLPMATTGQRIATGFHRNTMLNEEGGIDPLEYRFYAMVDRVATTGTVWLGLTTGCAQCHSHKYDPISHTDYYQLMALLNNADEPDLRVPDPNASRQRRELQAKIEDLEAALPSQFPPMDGDGPIEDRRRQHLETSLAEWIESQRESAVAWTVLRPIELESNLPKLEVLSDGSVFSSGDATKRDVFRLRFSLDGLPRDADATEEQHGFKLAAMRLEAMPDERLPAGGPGRAYYEGRKGDFFLSEVKASVDGKPLKFSTGSQSFGKISIGSGNANAENVFDGDGSTGWSTSGREGEAHQLVLNLTEAAVQGKELEVELLFERHFVASLGRFRISIASSPTAMASTLPVELESLLTRSAGSWTKADRDKIRRHYLRIAPDLEEVRKQINKLRSQLPELPTTMVMLERPADNPRSSYRYHRGEYLSPREEVTPGLPELFRDSGTEPSPSSTPTNRLEFARWLVSKDNPLVGRVTVNRAWRAFFGDGIVRTSGDFGTQSAPPSHPSLLDWMAVEFADHGLSMKELHRLIVSSATYRQSSRLTAEMASQDPSNRLLARGPRTRLDAEMIRDLMLKASGLLSSKIGGPSVYPPQPASVTGLAYGNTKWNPSAGEDRYRRSLYTFSKRTAPFAAYAVFDGPTGENCLPRRDRSNTPLQALTLLNDEMYLEMAKALAARAVSNAGPSAEERAVVIFRHLLTRPPDEGEVATLVKFQAEQHKRLESNELNASKIAGKDDAELASWVMVARAMMNLDEVITKQ